jgi:hypothetical protein
VRWVHDLLTATASRPGHFGCFGLHEWAMVYRTPVEQLRHPDWPLRLGADGVAALVEERGVRCGHVDAFRFFSPAARPLNRLQPTRADQQALEQPGCLHANMDLYKWAYKLLPALPSELVMDCFELSWQIRAMDMQASPYDLAEWGYPPIPIETPQGKAAYVEHQRSFAAQAARLRERLTAELAAVAEGAQQSSA